MIGSSDFGFEFVHYGWCSVVEDIFKMTEQIIVWGINWECEAATVQRQLNDCQKMTSKVP